MVTVTIIKITFLFFSFLFYFGDPKQIIIYLQSAEFYFRKDLESFVRSLGVLIRSLPVPIIVLLRIQFYFCLWVWGLLAPYVLSATDSFKRLLEILTPWFLYGYKLAKLSSNERMLSFIIILLIVLLT